MTRSARLREILALDPRRDHQRIVHLDVCYEFPFDTTRALEFALFRTYCVPSISALLDRTGEFRRRPQKRYDDTDILISEMMEWGYDSERGAAALARMNAIHGRFRIANADFLYVLSTFVFEPIRWNRRFGWRPMREQEKEALYRFWRAMGERMGIRDIPTVTAPSSATTSPTSASASSPRRATGASAKSPATCSRTGFRRGCDPWYARRFTPCSTSRCAWLSVFPRPCPGCARRSSAP